jgi:hypothetical protein
MTVKAMGQAEQDSKPGTREDMEGPSIRRGFAGKRRRGTRSGDRKPF